MTVLKEELEKRGLPKKGVKTLLISRLKNAILKEELEVFERAANERAPNERAPVPLVSCLRLNFFCSLQVAQSKREDFSSEELIDTDAESVKDVSQVLRIYFVLDHLLPALYLHIM